MDHELISRDKLVETISNLSEDVANYLMDLAVKDTSGFLTKDLSKEEISYKLYRVYLIGYALGINQPKL